MDESYLSLALASAAERMLEQRLVKTYRIATPAVGSEWSITVPGGVIWEVLSIINVFQTSAVVANRASSVRFRDADTNTIARFGFSNVVAASTAATFTLAVGEGSATTNGPFVNGLPSPPIPLPGSYTVVSATSSLDAGDQYSAGFITVREWSETDVVQELIEIAQQLDSLTLPEVTGRVRF